LGNQITGEGSTKVSLNVGGVTGRGVAVVVVATEEEAMTATKTITTNFRTGNTPPAREDTGS